MSATDRLRKMLDERGVPWDYGVNGPHSTEFYINRHTPCFIDWRHGLICTTILSPEDVVELFVDGRTCRVVDNEHGPNMRCTACGGEIDDEYRWFMERLGYSRCPHCGARIEVIE